MTRALRWDDPRCGREHFDARAGVDWECGPDPWDTTWSIPDVPWNKYKRTLSLEPPNRLLSEHDRWAVTTFGLQPLYSSELEQYAIPASDLPRLSDCGRVYHWPIKAAKLPSAYFASFEAAFRKALDSHCRKLSIVIDGEMLDRSFRQAHGIRKRARAVTTDDRWRLHNLPRRIPNTKGATVVRVERLEHRAIDGSRQIWLQFRSLKGAQGLPRLPTYNDRLILNTAYPSFFFEGFDGPQEVRCAAEWVNNEWFLWFVLRPPPTRARISPTSRRR
jgi:hypothetical protein